MTIGIVCPTAAELRHMVEGLPVAQTGKCLDKALYQGVLGSQQIVIASSGIGKTRAAARTQFLIDRFQVDRLISIGVAGGINPQLSLGDVVVSTQAREHDLKVSSGQQGQQQASRELLDVLANFKEPDLEHWYQADAGLVKMALEAGQRLGVPARAGSMLSGDLGIIEAGRKEELHHTWGADCVEMAAAGATVALVCQLNQVPFVLIRGISDLADPNWISDFAHWFFPAGARAGAVALEVLKGIDRVQG